MGLSTSFCKFPLGLGGGSISGEGGGYGFGDMSEKDALSLLHHAFELGFRLFDTAPIYGFGLSEIRMGKAFKNRREEVCIVSKSGITWDSSKRVNLDNSPKNTQKMLEQSLRDLDTDYIDLYMIHWPDSKVDIRRPLEVYAKALDSGKIRQVGLCNTNKEDLQNALEIVDIHAVQSEFHLLRRDTLEDLRELLQKRNISFMSWGTLDKGILTGRVNRHRRFDKSDCRSHAPWWNKKEVLAKVDKIDRLAKLMEESNISKLQTALAHNLREERLTIALCGVSNKEQLNGLVSALDHLPSNNFLQKIIHSLQE